MNKEVFAKIPNAMFSIKTVDENTEKVDYDRKGSILQLVKDDKVIKVMYELIVGTNFRNICNTSINDLISLCGYKVNDKNIKSFKELLYKMDSKNIIHINNEFYRGNDLISIDTENLLNMSEDGYTVLEQKELDIINNITKDSRQRNTLLKCYLFIKLMCHKREDNTSKGLTYETKPQTITMDYKYICKFTGVTDVTKAIKTLQDNKLIIYSNFLINEIDCPENKQDAKNTYAVYALEENWDEELTKEELKIGINQYKNRLIEKGFSISLKYLNNDKSANGYLGKQKQIENKNKKEI